MNVKATSDDGSWAFAPLTISEKPAALDSTSASDASSAWTRRSGRSTSRRDRRQARDDQGPGSDGKADHYDEVAIEIAARA